MAKFTFVDLFAGIGGFHIAAESMGGKSVGFSEIAKDAINAYILSNPELKNAKIYFEKEDPNKENTKPQ